MALETMKFSSKREGKKMTSHHHHQQHQRRRRRKNFSNLMNLNKVTLLNDR